MKFPCPLCSEIKVVRINRRSKPFLRCDRCGVLMFVNREAGINLISRAKAIDTGVVGKDKTLASFFDQRYRE